MSSKVNGCLPVETLGAGVCATTEVVSARLIARKTFMSRKGSAEVADMQSVARVAHASRVLVSASRRNGLYEKVRDGEDAIANTGDACATRSFAVVELRSKRFPRHFQAQSFDLLKLILRPLFELGEICALQRRKIRRNRAQ